MKNTRSTPYSWSVENLTQRPRGPAKERSSTKFFLPRISRIAIRGTSRERIDVTYPLENVEQVALCLVCYFLGIKNRLRCHVAQLMGLALESSSDLSPAVRLLWRRGTRR